MPKMKVRLINHSTKEQQKKRTVGFLLSTFCVENKYSLFDYKVLHKTHKVNLKNKKILR